MFGDANGDDVVNIDDAGILASQWQQTQSGPTFAQAMASFDLENVAVPEPATALVLAMGSLGLFIRRRR